jgi:hypothetical protein
MFYKENFGVVLPKQEMPWILDGRDQPKSVKRVFVTPYGTFPRMSDITALYGRSKREVEDRRMKRTTPKFDGWYIIAEPTVEDVQKAIAFVNDKYVEFYSKQDNCEFCNSIDNALFADNCWLISTTHSCGGEECQYPYEMNITYSYKGVEFTVNLEDWLEGLAPHKMETADE